MTKDCSIYILGAGGHAKVVISALQATGKTVKALFDDDSEKWGQALWGYPVLGPISEFDPFSGLASLIAVGDNRLRRGMAVRFRQAEWETIVHPAAFVDSSARLGPGTVVFAGAVIQPDAVIGAHCIINTGATIDHDCVLGDFVHVAPGCHIGGGVALAEGVFLGIGGTVIPGKRVGFWTTVGAGGVVTNDLPANVLAVGVPAKLVKIMTNQ